MSKHVARAEILSLELLIIVGGYVVALVILTRGFLADLRDLRERSLR